MVRVQEWCRGSNGAGAARLLQTHSGGHGHCDDIYNLHADATMAKLLQMPCCRYNAADALLQMVKFLSPPFHVCPSAPPWRLPSSAAEFDRATAARSQG